MKHVLMMAATLAALSSPLYAAQRTAILSVPGMTCAACPIVVKKAISRIDGVIKTEVDFNKRQAVVTYDDAKANIDQVMQATANAGYPAMRLEAGK